MFGTILTSATTTTSGYSSIFFLLIIFVVFYFFLIRPENKKKKKLQEMRKALSVGDEIVTIGGMMGKAVQVTEETVTFETGEDRVRIQVTKWAISSNVREDAKAQAQQPAGGLFGFGKKKKSDDDAPTE
ncbi:MAG: preprotein translocase subunit YajC [Clostridia bacterium]|nr:preprotein translocase subunit YajC [Clostridia bacterium]